MDDTLDNPFLVISDFNEILPPSENTWFIWEKGKLCITNIRERLDRGTTNNSWLELFPDFLLRHLRILFQTLSHTGIDKGELYWEQQARSNWLRHEDHNTTYFPHTIT
ncbi:hypothetical protein GQ457_16G014990 [Hibiscus cannabinus]